MNFANQCDKPYDTEYGQDGDKAKNGMVMFGDVSVDWYFLGWEVEPRRMDLVKGEVQGRSSVIKVESGWEAGRQEDGRIGGSWCGNGGALGLYDFRVINNGGGGRNDMLWHFSDRYE